MLTELSEFPESFFSLTYTREDNTFNPLKIGSTTEYRLLLNNNEPDEDTWRRVLASLLAPIDHEQRAKTRLEVAQVNTSGFTRYRGGHVILATDTEAKAFEDHTSLKERAPEPRQCVPQAPRNWPQEPPSR